MTTAIYARCSSEESAMKGLSIQDQVERCKTRAGELDLEVVEIFRDEGISAGVESREHRAGFEEMIKKAKAGAFKSIICLDTSRFSRDPIEAHTFERLLEQHGVKVIYVMLPEVGPYTEIVRMIFRAMDRFHSITSSIKARQGMEQAVRQGYRAGGPPPYGYKLKQHKIGTRPDGTPYFRTTLTPDYGPSGDAQGKTRAQVIREYFERRAAGEGRKRIAQDFDRRGIRTLRGRPWNISTFVSMEDNLDVYLGHTVWNRTKKGFINKEKSEHIRIEGTHPALISEELAQKVKARRRHTKRTNGKYDYAFTGGILKCGHCGHTFHGNQGIYCCTGRVGRGKDFCPNEGIKANVLEEGVAQIIREIYDEEQIEKLIGQRLSAQRSREKSVVDLRHEKKDIQKRLERLEEAYMTGKMDPDYFLELSGPLKARLQDVDEELSRERESDKINPIVLRQAIGIFLESLACQPESLRNFVQELTIYPHNNGERRIELSLAVRLPKEKVSKLGINMVAVRGIEPRSDG